MSRRLSGPVPQLGRIAVLAQIFAAIAFVALLLDAEGVRLPFTGSAELTLSAAFTDADGLQPGERTPVLLAGVPVGSVTGVAFEHGVAVVTMRLSSSARGVVRRDATARIEPRSALEDLTVDISPGSGSAPAAPDGMRLSAGQTEGTTTLDRVVSLLDADTRAQLSILLDQLSAGTAGRSGQLRVAIGELHGLLSPAARVSGALARRRVLLSSLVGSLSRIATIAQRHDAAITQSLAAGEHTLSALAAQHAALSSAVSELPATLSSFTGALANLRSLATPLAGLLSELPAVARELPAALGSARRVTPAAGRLLSAAGAFAGADATRMRLAGDVAGQLAGTATALTPAIVRVQPIVSAVNARRAGIGQLGERFSGVLSTDDANGPILRGLGAFEPFNPADFGFPGATGAKKLEVAGKAALALKLTCLHGGLVACLVRYLVPGLPGAVR